MAQVETFIVYGGIEIIAGNNYTSDNISADLNAFQVTIGTRILDRNGNDTPYFGLNCTIIPPVSLTAPVSPLNNISAVFKVGEIHKFIVGATYHFFDSGSVNVGKMEVL